MMSYDNSIFNVNFDASVSISGLGAVVVEIIMSNKTNLDTLILASRKFHTFKIIR